MVTDCQIRAEERWLADWNKGPTRLRWDRLPVQVGDKAPIVALLDRDGRSVSSEIFWREGPALVMFWRQFGCGCGIERSLRLAGERERYRSLGAHVAIIGQGEPEQATAYAASHNITTPVYVDPERRAFAAFGLLEGQPFQFYYDATDALRQGDLEAGVNFARERKAQGRAPVDSPWQLPGEFVVDRAGIIRLAYRYQYCEDFPNPDLLVAAIAAAS